MDELSSQVSILINLFLSEVCRCGKSNLFNFANAAYNVDWHGIVPSENLIDLDVILLAIRSRRVPAKDLLSSIDAPHHVEHFFVINVIEEPDVWLIEVLLERHSVAISHLKLAFVTILSQKHTDNSLSRVLSHTVVVVNN